MKSKFYISGMICSNCQKTVSDKIKAYEGVLDVKVSLETGLAEIDSKQYLEVFEISKLLGTKYTVKRDISRSKKETKLKLKHPLMRQTHPGLDYSQNRLNCIRIF